MVCPFRNFSPFAVTLVAILPVLAPGCSDPAPTAQLSKAGGTGSDADTLVAGSDIEDTQAPPEDTAPDSSADTVGTCIVSADCPGEKDLCISGACQPQTMCTSDKQCQASGLVCDSTGGTCVQCLSVDDCKPGEQCKAHKCLLPAKTCASTKDCDLGMVCDKGAKQCVECATSGDCSKGLACVETVCVPMLCKPGTTSCLDEKVVRTCTSDGMGYEQADCPGSSVCVAGDCAVTVCEPGKPVCVGAAVATCNETGTALGEPVNCDDTQVCENGQCLTPVCKPGAVECQNGQLATCGDNGTSWTQIACENGKVCSGGQCVAKVCQPGLAFCDGGQPKQCDAAGGNATPLTACTSGQVCLGGQCVATACKAGQTVCADATSLATCKTDGSGYSSAPCPSGSSCEAGACKSQVCQANLAFCQGSIKSVCNATGTASTTAEDCSKSGKICSAGACLAQQGYKASGGFAGLGTPSGAGYRVKNARWLLERICSQGFCIQGGIRP